MASIPNETEDQRASKAGIKMSAAISGLILLFVLSRADYVPRIIRFKQIHPSLFWWTIAIIGVNIFIVLLAGIVLWNCPPRPLIPDNRLTARIKQAIKFLVGVTTFGLAAFWGALAGTMMPTAAKDFSNSDMDRLLGQIVGEPLKFMTMLALMGIILVLCFDLHVVGREKRESTFQELRPALAWLCTSLTSPQVIGASSYLSLAMIASCGIAPAVT